jgi:hypothetical protein
VAGPDTFGAVRWLSVLLLVGLMAVPSTAAAAPGVIQNLPGCETNALAADDDNSSPSVALGFEAQMFDTSFDHVYVNNNGNVTVDGSLRQFTPFDFRETGQAMIAPFFGDVDTTGGIGSCATAPRRSTARTRSA